MRQRRSIAVAQTCPVAGDVAANLEEHLWLTDMAAEGGAQIALFPELSLSGYELGLMSELAFTEDDLRLVPLVNASAATGVTLVVGAPLWLGPRLHIGAFILSPDRSAEVYTKHYLGAFSEAAAVDGTVLPAEATVFAPGTHNPLLRHGDTLAAVAVCADVGRPSHSEAAARRGATAYLASMFVIPSEFEGDAAKLRSYAKRHAMMVALANYGGPSGGLKAAGRSSVWSETGELLAQLDGRGAGVAVVCETRQGRRVKTLMLDEPSNAPCYLAG